MKVLVSAVALATLLAGPAYAACTYPKAPDKLPNGSTATMEEMVAAQKQVKQFDADITAYQACLKLEHADAVEKLKASEPDEKKRESKQKDLEKILTQKNDAAFEEAQGVASRFNEQVRAFKDKSKK
jgi:hypothetical protein